MPMPSAPLSKRSRWSAAWSRYLPLLLPVVAGVATLVFSRLAHAAPAEGFAEAAGRGTGSAFLFALTAGLLTALTPCVYPMIPITISIFGGKGTSRRRSFALATFYVAGIAVMFGTLGTVFALLGRAFGTFLANPFVVVPLALLFVAMAASMFGAFELALPMGLQQRLAQVGGRGFAGAFLMGLVGGLIAAPCTGPPLAGILAYVATTRDAPQGFLLLATYACGIGVPFWLIAGFSMQLPKSGRWMEAVKSVFGIALLVAALYYLKNVVPALAELTGRTNAFLLGALVLAAVGLIVGAVHLSFYGSPATKLRKGFGVALVTVGLFAVTNFVLTPKIELAWMRSEATRGGRGPGRGQTAADRLHGRLVPALQRDGSAGVRQPLGRQRAAELHPAEGGPYPPGPGSGAGSAGAQVRGHDPAGGALLDPHGQSGRGSQRHGHGARVLAVAGKEQGVHTGRLGLLSC